MTTSTTLASVPESQIDDLRSGLRDRIEPSATFRVAHRFAERMEFEPVRTLLTKLLQGGKSLKLSPEVDASSRMHSVQETGRLAVELDQVWQTLQRDPAFEMHRLQDWFASEIDMVSRAFRHAARTGECIVQTVGERRSNPEPADGSLALPG